MRSSLCEAVLDHLIVLGQLQHQCFLCVRYRSQDLRLFCTMSIQLLILVQDRLNADNGIQNIWAGISLEGNEAVNIKDVILGRLVGQIAVF